MNKKDNDLFDTIGIDKNIKFGLEIEAEDVKKSDFKNKYNKELWKLKTDPTLKLFNNVEFSSIPFIDIRPAYKSIYNICEILKKNNANVEGNSSLQIHYDASIFNDDADSLINFYKMWCIYENIIYRYSYGKKLKMRKTLKDYSDMIGKVFDDANKNGVLIHHYNLDFDKDGKIKKDLLNYSLIVGCIKRFGFSFRYYNNYGLSSLKTIEFRTMNGTLDISVIKNYLKFFYSFLAYCSNNPDKEYISYLYENTNLNENNIRNSLLIDIKKAEQLADMIYTSTTDKDEFMKLYLKDDILKLRRVI